MVLSGSQPLLHMRHITWEFFEVQMPTLTSPNLEILMLCSLKTGRLPSQQCVVCPALLRIGSKIFIEHFGAHNLTVAVCACVYLTFA